MQYISKHDLDKKKAEIVEHLKLPNQPVNLSPDQTAQVLDTKTSTLSIWRSQGRYNLTYVKISRRVAYPLTAVAEFLLSREMNHTSDGVA